MSPVEQNYDIYNKKLLVIIFVFGYWKIYFEKIFTIDVYTDYKNLFYFITSKKFN